ncbi:MAG: DUF4297 domain-containing protein [Candidatus Dormibacteraeota bacterium]|nr:DUF4297 domain-containing protein [Candidatus Dormibacteraeota bacterium]
MIESFSGISPPDDSGTDAMTRFRYQAHVTFRFCLACYFEQGVLAVTPEHFEDVLVEATTELRFVQIKTRNADRGPWKFRHLMDDGGALRSLLRTHRALAGFSDGRAIVYDIRLEGALERSDPIHRLARSEDQPDDSMCQTCATRLGCDLAEAGALLGRVIVHAYEPPRDLIEDRNLRDLGRAAGHLSANELKAIYDAAISLIDGAMHAELLSDVWPLAVLETNSVQQELADRVAAKRIDRARLAPILGRLEGSDRALLSFITDPDRLRATDLERKMLAAGASAPLVAHAKQVRAQAAHRMLEFRASSLLDVDRLLADLEFRLLSVAKTAAATTQGVSPAIWAAIETRLIAQPGDHDPRRILSQEPLLLLGAICQYSDECKFAWSSVA